MVLLDPRVDRKEPHGWHAGISAQNAEVGAELLLMAGVGSAEGSWSQSCGSPLLMGVG